MDKLKGQVKFFNDPKGFGFLQADGKDYFVHVSNVEGDILLTGEEVEFKPVEGQKGLQAIEVIRLAPPVLVEELGSVNFYDEIRGFGFIKRDSKADVFAHFTDFEGIEEATSVHIGMQVSFTVRQGRDGRDRAYKIKVLN
jgi:CspA family cold shock protein